MAFKLFPGRVLKTYTLEVPAAEHELGAIRDFITDIATRAGFSLPEINNLKLALDEACSNIIRHAYKGMDPGPIRMRVLWRKKELDITLQDLGRGFDWKKTQAPDLNRYVEIGKKGGLGIWFIRKLMDKTSYHSNRRGNFLRLVKYVKAPAWTVPPLAQLPAAGAARAAGTKLEGRLSIRIKFLVPVMISVAVLVLLIFVSMFRNQNQSMRTEIMSNAREGIRRLSRESVNYMLKQDDLHLAALVKNTVSTNPKLAYAFVVNNENIIWAHSKTHMMFRPFQPPPGFKTPAENQLLLQTLHDPELGLIHDLSTPVDLKDLRLGIAHLGVKEKAILSDIQSGRRQAVFIFIIAMLASTTGAYFLMTILVAPIQKLTDGMLAISQGKLDHRISIPSNDEFGRIAQVFNEMTQRFTEAQSHLLEEERIQQEMQVAQEIQHTLLPREVPQVEGYDVASLYRSAKEVGGDYFDFMLVDDNTLGIAIADVSGKGVPGSLVMTMIRTALRLEARGNRSATDVMAKVNDFVTPDMKKGMFVTMFYIILDARQRVINFSSAGHNPLILYRAENDRIYYLKPRGFPVGIDLPDPRLFGKSLTQEHVDLKKGDLLLAYTDGITEAMNPRREQFGEERLGRVIRENHHLSANEFVNKLSEELAAFTENYPQNDDITCVVIKEKLMADAVQINLRRKLFYLVEKKGFPVAEACRQLNLSPSTYYRLKRLRDTYGVKAMLTVAARSEAQIHQLSLDERRELLVLVSAHPELGAKRLSQMLAAAAGGKITAGERMVYQELKRLRLGTRQAREAYAAKKKVDEPQKAMLPSH